MYIRMPPGRRPILGSWRLPSNTMLSSALPIFIHYLLGSWNRSYRTLMGTARMPISLRSAVGLDVGYFQRIELVDGDGSNRFEKLAVDFDEGRISYAVFCLK